jgi:hypothetical protein
MLPGQRYMELHLRVHEACSHSCSPSFSPPNFNYFPELLSKKFKNNKDLKS